MEPTPSETQNLSPETGPTGVLPVVSEHIVRTPGTCWGRPRIAGTRIKVEQVVLWHLRQGMSLEQIVKHWPHLTLADLHAALAYYYDHCDEIEADLADGQRLYDELKAKQPSIFEELPQPSATDNPVPPG